MTEAIDNPFRQARLSVLEKKRETPEEDNPFRAARLAASKQSKETDNPFKAARLAAAQPEAKAPEFFNAFGDPITKTEFDQPQTADITPTLGDLGESFDALTRGFYGGSADFYKTMKGAVRILKGAVESEKEIDKEGVIPGFLPMLSDGADYLVQKFGGTREGALDLLENGFESLEKRQRTATVGGGDSAGDKFLEGVGAFPQEAANFVLALEAGGLPGLFGYGAAKEAGSDTATPESILLKGGQEAAFGAAFKWMETLVPAVPKNFGSSKGVKESSELNIEFGPPQKEPSLLTPLERTYTQAVREFYPLEKAAKQLGDAELKYATRTNVGNAGNAKHFLEFGTFNAETKQLTGNAGLLDVVKQVPRQEWKPFQEYLVAKRGLELEGAGIKSGQDVSAMERIAAAGDANPVYAKAAQDLYQYQDDVLRYAVDSGLLAEEAYGAIKARWQNYIPFFRAGKPAAGSSGAVEGGVRQPIKAIEGSERAVVDPFRSIVQQTVRILNAADKNRLARKLTRHEGKPGAEKLIVRAKNQPAKLADDAAVLDDPLLAIEDVEVRSIGEGAESLGAPTNFKEFRVYENGQPTHYMIDPDLANAIGTYNLKDGSNFLDDIVINALSTPAKVLRAGTVDLPAFFLVKNPIRDQLTLAFQTKTGAKPGIALFDGLFSYLKRDEAYKLWTRTGGANSTLVSMDRPAMRKMFREMMSEKNASHWREIGEVAMTPLRVMQEIAQAMEAATRIGEFKQGLRNVAGGSSATGRSPLGVGGRGSAAEGAATATPAQLDEIATASRDVTVDFGIKGQARIAQWVRKLWAFSNAQVQGVDRFVRLHKENPGKAAAMGTMLLSVPTLALHAYQMQDEEYREKYRRLPNWRKTMFWNIDSRFLGGEGDRMVAVPIPFEWGLVYKALPEAALSSYMLDDPSFLQKMSMQIFNDSQPILTVNDDPERHYFDLSYPTFLQPIIDIKANRRSFFDVPIHSPSELELPKEMRFGENTAVSAQLLSEWMRGTFSPKEIEVLVQGYSGALGRSALQAADRALPPGPFGDIPSMRAFGDRPVMDFMFGGLANRTVAEGGSQVVADFWETYNRTVKWVKGFAELEKRGDAEGMKKMWEEHGDDIQTGWLLGGRSGNHGVAKSIMEIGKVKRQILRQKGVSERDKDITVRRLNKRIDALASSALRVPQLPENR